MTIHLTLGRLLEILSYDPDTGVFRWRVYRARLARAGMIAGNSSDSRYVVIQIDGKSYYAHRLAWFYVHHEWPPLIDHIDGNGLDNRISNLRAATKSLNAVNMDITAANTSGYRGVSWSKRYRKWVAKIKVDGRQQYIGSFSDKASAAQAYQKKALEIFGEFVR